MASTSRIEELRRRVDKDPASIAFAQLAEEYRRAGQYEDSARVCRAGLAQHPGYVSARVTLGLSLVELGEREEARAILEGVLQSAPDNQTASRALAELAHRSRTAAGPAPAASDGRSTHSAVMDRALPELERWLAAIKADRAAREKRL